MLNRSLVILKPKAPYVEWASALPGPSYDENEQDSVAYLVPDFESNEQGLEVLGDGWTVLFDTELGSWHSEQADWPQDRSFEMFKTWFDIQLVSMVFDLCGDEIVNVLEPKS